MSRYDAWLPLRYLSTRAEEDAVTARVFAHGAATADDRAQATSHAVLAAQRESRGAVRLRLRVTWEDGGVAAARSALRRPSSAASAHGVAQPCLMLPRTASGRRTLAACRFAVYGPPPACGATVTPSCLGSGILDPYTPCRL